VAAAAAIVSYDHMRTLAEWEGESWKSSLIPLAIDGMVIAASTVPLAQRRAGQPGGVLAWLAQVRGVLVSLAANAANPRPTLVGRPPAGVGRVLRTNRTLIVAGSQQPPAKHQPPATRLAKLTNPHQPPLEQRAAELLATGQRNGQPIERGRLARELDISQHQARQLLDRLATNTDRRPVRACYPRTPHDRGMDPGRSCTGDTVRLHGKHERRRGRNTSSHETASDRHLTSGCRVRIERVWRSNFAARRDASGR
jgi:hypothetical protein